MLDWYDTPYISHELYTMQNVNWSRTSMCYVCLSLVACPHNYMDLDVTFGNGGVPPSCALLGEFAIGT